MFRHAVDSWIWIFLLSTVLDKVGGQAGTQQVGMIKAVGIAALLTHIRLSVRSFASTKHFATLVYIYGANDFNTVG